MTVELVKDVFSEVIKTVLMTAGPVLLVSLAVGLAISFFQSITQIQEFTLTFVPKILAVFICILVLLPFFASTMVNFTRTLITNIPIYVR